MQNGMTRSRLIQGWFGAVALLVIVIVASGITVTIGTAVMLLALAVAAPVILLLLWPAAQPPTASQVLHDTFRP